MSDADQILHTLLQNIATKQKFTNYDLEVTPLDTCGAHFTSNLFIANITEGKHEFKTFAKVAAIGKKIRDQYPVNIYDTEMFFYTKLVKVFRQLEEKNNVPEEHRLKVPEFYGCNDKLYKEAIVLENLIAKGYSTHDRFKSLDWEYAASAVTELAKYQALSVAFQIDNQEEFEKVLSEFKFEILRDDDRFKEYWKQTVKKSIEVATEQHKEKLKNFFNNGLHRKTYMDSYSPIKLTVIAHGDYKPSNLMYRVKEDGSVDVIPVDYQNLRGGSPVADLFHLIFTGTDSAFRAQYYDKLIDHYYTEFSAALTRLGLNPDEIYTREDYDFEIKEKLPFGLAIAVFSLPFVTVEPEHAPKATESMELADFAIKITSKLFLERLNEIIDDFVRWGVLA